MKPVTRVQAAALGLLAALLLAVAWLTDRPAGPVMALAGGILGWLISRMTPNDAIASPQAASPPPPAVVPSASSASPLAQVPEAGVTEAGVTKPGVTEAGIIEAGGTEAGGGGEWTKQLSILRHDLRGILSPAMLIADRLLSHADPAVQRAGEVVNRTVERAAARLTDKPPAPPAAP